ncbi:membrane cofactor protein-like isoform X2 [Leuresthes tenuis]|uniref:membrane cofactor protein-like isoform X2 n=1 Tax=Leuresthes tenuis TaxID=355514 RepID=UPI003B512757
MELSVYWRDPGMGVAAFILLSLGLAITAQAQNCTKPQGGPDMSLTDDYISYDTFPNGTRVRFSCNVGYTSAGGSPFITCSEGTWTAVKLNCERKSCGSAGEVENGEIHYPEGIDFGAKASVTCKPGYVLVGNSELSCGDGGWMGRLPVCEVVTCRPPPLTDNAVYAPELEVYDYGGAVVYSCNNGFILNGSRELTCSDSGIFSPAPPNCIRVECEDAQIPNGEVSLGSSRPPHGHKSSLTFECSKGYKLIGISTVICEINSQWVPPIPKCEKVIIPTTPTTTTTTTTTTTSSSSGGRKTTVATSPTDSHGNGNGLAVGLGIGGVVLVAIVIFVGFRVCRKRGKHRSPVGPTLLDVKMTS